MRGIRTDRTSNKYTPVPQAVSDEDEGVYEESPESSQHAELLPTECTPAEIDGNIQNFIPQDLQELDFCSPTRRSVSHTLPLAFIEAEPSSKHSKMSCSRQICFILSILICMAYMVALLWLIPCRLAPCLVKSSHPKLPLRLEEWNRTFPSIHFVSRPQVVKLCCDGSAVILLAFQLIEHNATRPNDKKMKEVVGGVIALRGDDGKEVWRNPFYTDVLDVICSTDVNNDGIMDCTIIGSTGLLAAINASNGHTFWYLHDHNEQSMEISAISSPCILTEMDFDHDGVDDFAILVILTFDGLWTTRLSKPSWPVDNEQMAHVGLLLVSGSSGQIIGQPLPLPNTHTESSVIGYRKTPNLVVYDLGNGTKTLLLLLGSGDGSHILYQNNPEVILMITLDDLYGAATRDKKAEDAHDAEFREVYLGKGNIQSITIIQNEINKAGDILLLMHDMEDLICLDGSNNFQIKWSFHEEKSKISQPVLGNFNMDGFLDVFIILTTMSCSSCNCKSKALVLDGKTGQVITQKLNKFLAFDPFVIQGKGHRSTDNFLFKTVTLGNSSETHKARERKSVPDEALGYNVDAPNGTQSVLLLSNLYPNMSEQQVWNDLRNYGINKEFKKKPLKISENDYYLMKVEKVFDHQLSTEDPPYTDDSHPKSTGAEAHTDQSEPNIAENSVFYWNVNLVDFRRAFLNIHLSYTNSCQSSTQTNNSLDIVIEELSFGRAYLLEIDRNRTGSSIVIFDVHSRISHNHTSRLLQPTAE